MKEISVTLLKLLPLMVTSVPTAPDAGVNEIIVGGPGRGETVKSEVLVPILVEFVTLIGPVLAPFGTVATS